MRVGTGEMGAIRLGDALQVGAELDVDEVLLVVGPLCESVLRVGGSSALPMEMES